jgi:predicted nucleic acid-binding protein
VSGPPLVFLDANVLFSSALGGPVFELLLDLAHNGTIRLTTSRACVIEAETNLERKRPDGYDALGPILATVSIQAEVAADEHLGWAEGLIDPDDAHVLAAARRASADVLLTGDTTHFGQPMRRDDLGLQVRTPRAFLLEGPA